MPSEPVSEETPILFFDGVCGLCSRFVDFAMRHDRNQAIRFAPLQGETASQVLPGDLAARLDTVVFRKDGRNFTRSAAVVRLLNEFGGGWKLAAGLFWLLPSPLRDLAYRLVAKSRYRLFGRHETCRLPTPEERSRFLD